MISMSVSNHFCEKKNEINHNFESALGLIRKQYTLIKEQYPRQSTSADFRLPKIRCQSVDPKQFADLSPLADESTVRMPEATTARECPYVILLSFRL